MAKSPLAGVDVNLLVALDALLSEENVGQAARRVGLSASAMSHALSRLRGLLDDPLLVRSGRRMVPTARAGEVRGTLREGLELVAQALARNAPFDPATERRMLRIAAVDFAQTLFMPALMRTLAQRAPQVNLVLMPFDANVPRRLADGDLDLGIATLRNARGMKSRPVHDEPFVCVARSAHPALATRMTAARFAALDHVLVTPYGMSVGAVDRALKKRGLRRRVALVVPTFLVAAKAVAQSDMVLTCGRRSALEAQGWLGLSIFKPPVALAPFRTSMLWHERQEHDPFLAWVREQVQRAASAGA